MHLEKASGETLIALLPLCFEYYLPVYSEVIFSANLSAELWISWPVFHRNVMLDYFIKTLSNVPNGTS